MADMMIGKTLHLAAPRPLDTGWQMCVTAPRACAAPRDLHAGLDWIDAVVPGTAAGALRQAGMLDPAAPLALDARDIWYRKTIDGRGTHTLRFGGLATLCEVWLDERPILRSESMFLEHEVQVELTGEHRVALCFRSLDAFLADPDRPRRRARWRPRMIEPNTLNAVRTSILGHAPGWCPNRPIVGPYRAIELVEQKNEPAIRSVELKSTLVDGVGVIDCTIELDRQTDIAALDLACAGHRIKMTHGTSPVGGRRTLSARLNLLEPQLWWPHTHGWQPLYEVQCHMDGATLSLGRVGFRSVEADRGSDGNDFALIINGERVFCRGACWTPVDLLGLPRTREAYEPRLRLMREAGLNMVRIGGTMLYEESCFHQLCDELGILVWQDFMFANFDYPAAEASFTAAVTAEAERALRRSASSPSLAVICGGSEVYQQAAMLGMPERIWKSPLFEETLPSIAAVSRPDVPYVANSPSGGALPFASDAGVAHYYGVGAYLRPLDDARRAAPRFAAECLAFANIVEERQLPENWQTQIPRDAGADWDFADVRDHYLRLVFGCEPGSLLAADPVRYREASRAAIAHVMQSSFAEWRRAGSATNGALIWFLADLAEGSGWGILDAGGRPKSAWYALRQVLRPVQVLATDEGVNGLRLHVINETAAALSCTLRLRCLANGTTVVAEGSLGVDLPARSTTAYAATDLLGAFFDVTYAFRFGPPAHDVVAIELREAASDALLSSASYFPLGLTLDRQELGLTAESVETDDGPALSVSTQRFAAFVQIETALGRPAENWFHLAPGEARLIRLTPGIEPIAGKVRALNGIDSVAFGAAS